MGGGVAHAECGSAAPPRGLPRRHRAARHHARVRAGPALVSGSQGIGPQVESLVTLSWLKGRCPFHLQVEARVHTPLSSPDVQER